ncbi:Putative hemolysin [Cognatiyoonia sediminum]|uniref:Putative hemolysin n=1 Tax=Cognatiyoonia sediminum TaxID=1508389 RepID=A0A1M5KZ92_9RHOB|nr:DUF333 domain-containing protein [Cognatiyoonia sediminum]SHG58087.1 Putative hemolysin [Cognatiyoonia sediminum]
MKQLTLAIAGLTFAAGTASAQQLSPNPAATYCIENGGSYEIVQGANGATGICVQSDGTHVDAWDYFRQSQVLETTVQRLSNPAAVFCVEQGGAYQIVTDVSGAQRGLCVVLEAKTYDAWDYYRANH